MAILSVLFLLRLVSSAAEKHSLEYFILAAYGPPVFPEFMGTAVVDGVEFGYCDSKIKTAKPYEWATEILKHMPGHLEWYSVLCHRSYYFSRPRIMDLIGSLKQRGGMHFLQLRSGCEWDEETDEVVGFMKLGYDGEDFIALDMQALIWTALKQEALFTKLKWDTDIESLIGIKYFYLYGCPLLLREYLPYGRKFLQRTVLPSVSVLHKSSSSPVNCFATGFYPDRAVMFWRKDGEELYEDVDHGEILPNNDDTFQMSADLNISSVKLEDWEKYECVFQLYGVKEDIVIRLDKSMIPDGSPPQFPVVIGVVAGLLLLSVCIAGFIMWRKKKNGSQAVQWEQDDSETEQDSSM